MNLSEVWENCIDAVVSSAIINSKTAKAIADAFNAGSDTPLTVAFGNTGEIGDSVKLAKELTGDYQDFILPDGGAFDPEFVQSSFILWSFVQYVTRKGERGEQKNWPEDEEEEN